MRNLYIITVMMILSACSASGPQYSSMANTIQPEPNVSKFIIYRPSHFYASGTDYKIAVDNGEPCALSNGSFYITTAPAGKKVITADNWGLPGTSRLEFDSKPNQVYYVSVALSDSATKGSFLGGAIGVAIAESNNKQAGPFDLRLVDKTAAENELSDLNMTEDCKN